MSTSPKPGSSSLLLHRFAPLMARFGRPAGGHKRWSADLSHIRSFRTIDRSARRRAHRPRPNLSHSPLLNDGQNAPWDYQARDWTSVKSSRAPGRGTFGVVSTGLSQINRALNLIPKRAEQRQSDNLSSKPVIRPEYRLCTA